MPIYLSISELNCDANKHDSLGQAVAVFANANGHKFAVKYKPEAIGGTYRMIAFCTEDELVDIFQNPKVHDPRIVFPPELRSPENHANLIFVCRKPGREKSQYLRAGEAAQQVLFEYIRQYPYRLGAKPKIRIDPGKSMIVELVVLYKNDKELRRIEALLRKEFLAKGLSDKK